MKIPFVLVLAGLAGSSTMIHMTVCPCTSRGEQVMGKDARGVYRLLGDPNEELASKDDKQGLWYYDAVATCRASRLAVVFDGTGKVVDSFDPGTGEGARKYKNFSYVDTPAQVYSGDYAEPHPDFDKFPTSSAGSAADGGNAFPPNAPIKVRPIR